MAHGKVRHPVFARCYARISTALEAQGADQHRRELLAGLHGTVIEVGAGNGLNFAHYPTSVTHVLGVEPEPHLRRLAREAAPTASVPVDVVEGLAEDLPAADGSCDAVVASLVLCSVADPPAALAEMRRVLGADGELRFYEHVRARSRPLRRVQRLADATLWPRCAGGCHVGRDTPSAIEQAGFVVDRLRRFRFPDGRVPAPASPHVIGRAHPHL